MDRQEEPIAHELETILPANLHKTAPQRRFMPNLPIRHPQVAAVPAEGAFCAFIIGRPRSPGNGGPSGGALRGTSLLAMRRDRARASIRRCHAFSQNLRYF
jgi:hypothetical protein